MNTEQNYVDRGNYANTPPPAATNEAQTPLTLDERAILLRIVNDSNPGALDYLFSMLYEMDNYFATTNPIPTINKIAEAWLTSPSVNLTDSQNARHLATVLRLVTFLTELRDKYEVFVLDLDEDVVDILERGGVSNG